MTTINIVMMIVLNIIITAMQILYTFTKLLRIGRINWHASELYLINCQKDISLFKCYNSSGTLIINFVAVLSENVVLKE